MVIERIRSWVWAAAIAGGALTGAPAMAQSAATPAPAQPATPAPGQTAGAAGERVADPERDARKRIEATCLSVQYSPNFARRLDLNADGRPDIVVTFDVICDGYHSMFCGADGCEGAIYLARTDGGYTRTNLPPTAKAAEWNGLPAVKVPKRGPCRRKPCERLLIWNGRSFVPPSFAFSEESDGFSSADGTGAFGDAELAALAREAAAQIDGLTSDGVDPSDALTAAARERDASVPPELGDPAPDDAPAEDDAGAADRDFDDLPAEVEEVVREGLSTDAWFLSRALRRGRLTAAILGADGRSALFVSCGGGDIGLQVAVVPTETAALRAPTGPDETITLETIVDDQIVETRPARYIPAEGAWSWPADLDAAVIDSMINGSEVAFFSQEAGGRLGAFGLDRSKRVLDALRIACGA